MKITAYRYGTYGKRETDKSEHIDWEINKSRVGQNVIITTENGQYVISTESLKKALK